MDRAERARMISRKIKENFDRGAADYARYESKTAFFSMLAAKMLSTCNRAVEGPVLDVGCGSGASLDAVCKTVGSDVVVGLDLSLGMLKQARRKNFGSFNLVQADGQAADRCFRAGFGAVCFNAVLFMMPDGEGAIESAFRLLKPGGVLMCSVLIEGRVMPENTSLADHLSKIGFAAGRHAPTPWPMIEKKLAELFCELSTERVDIDMTAEGFFDFYGMEPMSHGLLPSLQYDQRLQVLRKTFSEVFPAGGSVRQNWKVAACVKGG